MPDGRIYMLQPSFAAGEISPDVASRTDLDKYTSALLQAKNCFIRPYGSVYRRPGTLHVGTLGHHATKLVEFSVNANISYLLEFYLCPDTNSICITVWKDGARVKEGIATPFLIADMNNLRFAQSADVMFITSGTHPVQVLKRYSDTNWVIENFVPTTGYFEKLTMTEGVKIAPSGISGTITLTASDNVFSPGQVGNSMQLRQKVSSDTVSLKLALTKSESEGGTTTKTGTSNAVLAGAKGWKVISHGTWAGDFSVQYSEDNVNWKTLRNYSSDRDNNITESGTFDSPVWIRVNGTVRQKIVDGTHTAQTLTIDLTRLPYTHKGTANITGYTSGTAVSATVVDRLADTSASTDWAFGAWSAAYGYPSCVAFFQDRLCFAASDKFPYMVWMSRTGDYYNFGTDGADGNLTDDSAVAVAFISRQDFRIKHLMALSDLVVMTEGNEWIISGNEVVTPKNVTPQVQTNRGCTDVRPLVIGGQMIYVQRLGKTVRDMQYSYATEQYDGMDLTILAKHITKGKTIIDAAYRQEPDYMIFFVLSDGTAACLTYINEQKVYAWSRISTDGQYKAVEVINTPGEEIVYFVVERDGVNYLEQLASYADSDVPDDYIMLDCAAKGENVTPEHTITAAWLANKPVDVLADGEHIMGLTADETGSVTLEVPVTKYVIGLRYASVMELPNIELQLPDGSIQGRKKKVSEVILRLTDSLAGMVGITEVKMDGIKFEELSDQNVTLYSGDKRVTVPNVAIGGFNDQGRVTLKTSYPYPFQLASIVRVVTIGG